MAYSYAMMGNLDKADRSLGKASFLLDTTDDEYFKSIYWLARAMISVLEKSYDEAVDYAQNVTNEHKDPGLVYYHGMANYLTAKCFLIKGEIGVATHYLGKSIDIISADTTDSQLDNIREEQTLTMNIIRSRRRPELIDSIANRSHLSQSGRDLVRAALINAHQNNYYHDIFTTVNPGSLGFGWTQTDTYRSQIIDLQFSLDSLRRVSGTPMCTHGNGGGSSAIAIVVAIVAVVAAVLTTVVARVRLRRIRHDYDSRIKIVLNDQTHLIDIQREKLNQTAGRIEDSIRYAEKIQHAMLPPPEDLNLCHIDGSFIFFNPLDIVSGDFYWFRQNGNKLLVCCADCTGHGVPGAFMSMIASTMIGEIFDKTPDCTPALMLEEPPHHQDRGPQLGTQRNARRPRRLGGADRHRHQADHGGIGTQARVHHARRDHDRDNRHTPQHRRNRTRVQAAAVRERNLSAACRRLNIHVHRRIQRPVWRNELGEAEKVPHQKADTLDAQRRHRRPGPDHSGAVRAVERRHAADRRRALHGHPPLSTETKKGSGR